MQQPELDLLKGSHYLDAISRTKRMPTSLKISFAERAWRFLSLYAVDNVCAVKREVL